MDETDRLRDWDRHHLWHAFSQMASYDGLIIQSAEGCWLTTIDGSRLLDGASSMWCNVHGHRHPVIDQAIRDQLDQVAQVTLLGMGHPVAIRLARRLA
ncbi:MAG: aminotransferase class III-fold pyridoxal phosphate-dependent enzyme, partial [Pirellulaceae bacterium]